MLSLLTACAQTPEPAELTKLSAATSESADAEETAVSQQTSAPTAAPIATRNDRHASAAPKLTVTPAPTPAPTPEPTAAPTAEPAPAQVSMSYGAVPFDLRQAPNSGGVSTAPIPLIGRCRKTSSPARCRWAGTADHGQWTKCRSRCPMREFLWQAVPLTTAA